MFHTQGGVYDIAACSIPSRIWTIGAFGVDLFFVVSGFIMVYASERLFGRRGVALPFMARRLARIAPLYWVFTAAFAGIAFWFGHLPGHPQASIAHITASFLFLPALRPEDGAYFPVYSLGWTLNYEMFFYLCFAATLALKRREAVATLSVILIVLVAVGRLYVLPWPLFYWANPIVLEFRVRALARSSPTEWGGECPCASARHCRWPPSRAWSSMFRTSTRPLIGVGSPGALQPPCS